ncbi:hypothetical protein [Nocardia asteroides]|uniref:hypothetical protein n=1 Tax=Nocardia asteroides TaxID=1824 RepID=UPI0033F8986E
MDIHAYPTDAHTPVDRAEAIRVAATHLPDIPGTDRHVVEFADGFAVFAVRPQHAPPDRPLPVGGSVHVVDKTTGAISRWPTYPVSAIEHRYTADRVIVEDSWPDEGD